VPDAMTNDLRRRMDSALEALQREFSGLRTGRASAHLLDKVVVKAYGSDMPINQVGNINVPEPRLISVQVWDRGLVVAVEKAIREAGLGLNPVTDGQLVRIPIPELSQARVAVRNVRREGMEALKKMEKDGKISQDDHRHRSDEVQKMTDGHIKKVDEALAQKEKEIMQV